MKINLPVTQAEYDYPDDQTLMSVTDVESHIGYANEAFVRVSGYSLDELVGQPHNLIRHPDMPPQAFADLWATLKAGQSWTAVVKNRRKNGDHYWVRANVTPMMRDGRLRGYMSVRHKPDTAEVAAADALYRDLREGRAGSRALHRGLVIRTGVLGLRSRAAQLLPAHWRIRLALWPLAPLLTAAAWAAGLGGAALMAFAGAAGVAACGAAAALEWQLARPLRRVLAQALAVAAGSTEGLLALNRVDEIGMILRAVNQAGLNLRALADDVSAQIEGLQTASREIGHGSQDLSARTEAAAASLQQTSAAMTEISGSVKHNADDAQHAAQLSGAASRAAERGGEIVGTVVATMDGIAASSQRIGDIIGVIDAIAFQTNILALNAAVEAARAGEQGRGFAVVAAEVRSLAQRSAEAAREIKSLIGASVEQVAEGHELVSGAGRAMADIVGEVRKVGGLIASISQSTRDQHEGIDQVAAAVRQLDETTQHNAALVEQTAAAVGQLGGQAERLSEAVTHYRARPVH